MRDKIFLDTNVMVYAYDKSAGEKHIKAREILMELWESGYGVISIQVLKEFYVTTTQKIPNKLGIEIVSEIISDFLNWEVVVNDGEGILEAISLQQRYNLSFWDALIVEAALESGCSFLYSEDLNPGQKIRGVQLKNPFTQILS